jgi:hypothetical protein
MNRTNPKTFKRPVKGPCIFCGLENALFTEEHLPPETVAGEKAVVLVDWVCAKCNVRFSIEDEYFAKHYHGSIGRVVYGVVGKKRKGAEVARKDIWAKFQPNINTVQLRIKGAKKRNNLLKQLESLDKRQSIEIEFEKRTVNTRRLGQCLAKMALETLACYASEKVLEPQFDLIRRYAFGNGPLRVLPFALGNPRGKIGVNLCDIKFDGSDKRVLVSLIFLPAAFYAVQLSDYDDLHPLWHVAKLFEMVFDEDGKRTRKFALSANFEFRGP